MESKSKISANIQGSKTLLKLSLSSAILSLALLIAVFMLSLGENVFIKSNIFAISAIPFAMALLFSLGAFFYALLGLNSAQEEEEKFLLLRRKESTSIINVEEDVRFTATKTFENYKRFAPYVMAILGAISIAAWLSFFYYEWNVATNKSVVANSFNQFLKESVATNNQVMIIAVVIMIISAFGGAFFSGQSRIVIFRYLKGVGAYLSLGFIIMLLATLGALANSYDVFDWYEKVFRGIIFAIFVVLACELVINFIIEFYRPRSMEESRPIFESKILSIFTEPGGVMRNIADTLDYQFGFKVSGTWIYTFIEKALFPLIIIWVLILWSFTSIHLVSIGELGVREEFGKVVTQELLEPGIYVSKPWPFGNIRCFSCKELRQIFIGHDPTLESHDDEEEIEDDGHGHGGSVKKKKEPEGPRYVVNWTESHVHGDEEESFFVLPSQNTVASTVGNDGGKTVSAVDLLAFSIPVQYRIRQNGIFDYAYLNVNPDTSLKRISEQVVINYLSSATLVDFMSINRKKSEDTILNEIQKMADKAKLGIEIVSVNLTEVHPPMANNTSAAFHEARMAQELASAMVLGAKAYRDRVIPEAAIKALQITEEALSYKYATTEIAIAEKSRFETQLKTYQVMPKMFILKSYLDFLEKDCKDIRKFVISSSLKNEVYEFNFEEKGALDLVDVDIDSLGK